MTVRPPLPAPPYEGGCACGTARYRLTARPLAVNACHCLDCKRLSGAGAGVFLHTRRATVLLDQGDLARYRRTADSGRQIDIARCATCGTRLWHEPLAVPELLLIAAGTLDDSRWAIPTSHIWLCRAAPDAAIAPDAITFDSAAPAREMLWARFDEIYCA